MMLVQLVKVQEMMTTDRGRREHTGAQWIRTSTRQFLYHFTTLYVKAESTVAKEIIIKWVHSWSKLKWLDSWEWNTKGVFEVMWDVAMLGLEMSWSKVKTKVSRWWNGIVWIYLGCCNQAWQKQVCFMKLSSQSGQVCWNCNTVLSWYCQQILLDGVETHGVQGRVGMEIH
jgi:hypothetical protein